MIRKGVWLRNREKNRIRRVVVAATLLLVVVTVIFMVIAEQLPTFGAIFLIGAAASTVSVPKFESTLRGIKLGGIDDEKGTERRLRILFALGARDELSFKTLGELVDYSAGAISHDLTRLEKKGLIKATRRFLPNGMRRTTYNLTEKGRQNLKDYLENIALCLEFFENKGS